MGSQNHGRCPPPSSPDQPPGLLGHDTDDRADVVGRVDPTCDFGQPLELRALLASPLPLAAAASRLPFGP